MELAGHVARMGQMRNAHMKFGRKTWKEQTTRKT